MFLKNSSNKLVTYLFLATSSVYAAQPQPINSDPTSPLPYNLSATLKLYGYDNHKQDQALRLIMKKAGIKNVDHMFEQPVTNDTELSEKLSWLVSQTQKEFFRRNDGKERWEVKTTNWMQDTESQKAILDALRTLDMLSPVTPKTSTPNAVCILGATGPGVDARFAYIRKLYMENNFRPQRLLMLAGERYVSFNANGTSVDGTRESLQQLANELQKPIESLTETDLMRQSYENSMFYGKFAEEDLVLFDTPRGNLPRPTTETTVKHLCVWLKEHPEVKNLCFVSTQPHVDYQANIIEQIFLRERVEVDFEVIGSEYKVEQDESSKINSLVQALGSKIWSKTPKIILALNLDTQDQQLQHLIKEQYARSPLFYNSLTSANPTSKQKPKP